MLDHTGNAQLNYLSKCDCEYDRSQPKIIYRLKHALSILEFCYVSHVPPGTCEFVKGKAMEKVDDVGGLVRYSLSLDKFIFFKYQSISPKPVVKMSQNKPELPILTIISKLYDEKLFLNRV